jgi:8-oxo-dGTP diphosphatase
MMHTILPSVNIFIIQDGKLLLGRRVDTGWMDGYLCPPGGHVEEGEIPTVAALRELKEELDIDLNPKELEFLCVAARNIPPREYVGYEFILRNLGVKPKNNEPEKCSELVWVDPHNLPSDVIPQFAEIIKRSLIGDAKYLELGYE